MPWRLGERKKERETVGERQGRRHEREAGEESEREHIRLRDLQWLYISQCLVKAARQGSGNLIIA